jgi:hypothetical protein
VILRAPGLRFARRGFVAALAMLALASAPASATSSYYNTWKTAYPASLSDDNVIGGTGTSCQLCHVDTQGGSSFNAYGWQLRVNKQGGASTLNSILLAAANNSDNDPTGSGNADEIAANAQPGWKYGNTNTWYFANGSTQVNKAPPAGIQGYLNSVWTNLANATPGAAGSPTLVGTGGLTSGSALTLTLSGAAPSAAAFLVVGFNALNAPFKGGVLVPDSDLLLPLASDPTGQLALPAAWPAGIPAGFATYFQYWVADAGGPKGYAATNGLKATAN